MSSQEELLNMFGESLLNPSAGSGVSVETTSALSGKILMLYFSAHWCPPCRQFTPRLIEFYNNLKNVRNDFELVFLSLDKSQEEWNEYTKDMPWLCTPHDLSDDKKQLLASKFKVRGIPHLLVLDASGKVISSDAVQSVLENPKEFPWEPKKMSELLPTELLKQDTEIQTSSLDDKYLMLYFSAHWCPPCKRFTPILSKAYTELKATRDDFELVFVSSDKDQATFDEYYGTMSFCALPFEYRSLKNQLSKRFGIQGIPSLLILGPQNDLGDRPLINASIRGVFESGNFLKDFPYQPKPYGDVNHAEDLNEQKCVIVFHESGDDDEQKELIQALEEASSLSDEFKYYWAMDSAGVVPRLRQALKLGHPTDNPVMVILDIPSDGGYHVSTDTDITVDTIKQFIENPGERRQLQ